MWCNHDNNQEWPGGASTPSAVTQRRCSPVDDRHYTCTKCGTVKPAADFGSDGRGGTSRRCKSCAASAARDWAAANRERKRSSDRAYYAAHRDSWPSNWRERKARDPDGFAAQHRLHNLRWSRSSAGKEARRQYYAENRERWRQYKLARRALERAATGVASSAAIRARWDYYGGRCWMCGEAATCIDHVVALSIGGTGWPANLRPACKPCNTSKGHRSWRLIASGNEVLP